jgi:hypothetical protein
MIQRRSFLSALSGALAVRPAPASAQSVRNSQWQPARHEEDDWLDQIPGKHRLIFDTTTTEGFGNAVRFGDTFLETNKNAYGLPYTDVALVIVARHNSTAFGYNDAMWSKYGRVFTQTTGLDDPKKIPSGGRTLESLLKRGTHLAVCRMATRRRAEIIASTFGGEADKINEELIANLVANARMVPAGIVAVSRAQERGYTFASGA